MPNKKKKVSKVKKPKKEKRYEANRLDWDIYAAKDRRANNR